MRSLEGRTASLMRSRRAQRRAEYNFCTQMQLTAGTRLGPYEIVAPLGAGGMGEVYRARDTKLGRDVAIKVLPAAFAQDADRLARFEQESKAAAALNHPNVMAVFDVGIQQEVPYVVSELLEGKTLESTLSQGALPLRTAIDIAGQLASGMAAAHDKGIVHRDLKPANIFLTSDGRAKILDFGLAKVTPVPVASSETTHLRSGPATEVGSVMGTAGYMSPEQVRGTFVDHRTDIFSFGAVFYEMLSGQRAFGGESSIETMAAILKEDPSPLQPGAVPPALERFVYRCLEKDPVRRFQSASDIAFALDALSASATAVGGMFDEPRTRRGWRPPLLGVGIVAGLAAGAAAVWLLTPEQAGVREFRPRTFDQQPITNARFMPDGQTIIYSATPQGYVPDLFVINPGAEAPRPLGVSKAQLLSVSSKGELALIVEARHLGQRLYSGTLARMTLGSSPRAMMENVREADWGPDGEALAVVQDLGNGRDRLEFPAGTALHEASGYLSDPRVSPDGASVAFFEHQWRFDDRGWVKVVDRLGTVTTLTGELSGLEGLAWTPDGASIVFSGNASGGSMTQPMSVAAAGGEPARSLFGVPGRFIVYDITGDGRMLAVREDLSLGVRAVVPGQAGERDLSWLGSSGAIALSGDGASLLMVDVGLRSGSDYGVVLRKTDLSDEPTRLGTGFPQRLSPDGRWASAIIATPPQLVLYPTGPGEAVSLNPGSIESFVSADWFPDSRQLLVCGSETSRAPRCYRQDTSGSPPSPVTDEGVLASLAPDGQTLLLKLQDGTFQISSLEGGASRPVPALQDGDRKIAWSRDSKSVFIQRGTEVPARVERIDLATGARTVVRELAPEGFRLISMLSVTDWVDDGRYFVYNYTTLPSTLFVVSGTMY